MSIINHNLIITLASKNEGKRMELLNWMEQSDLPITIALNPNAEDVEETGKDFLENAALKARQTPAVIGSNFILAEDSGIVIDALDGYYGLSPFPGLYSNRWMTPKLRDELLGQSFPNRMPLDRITATGVSNSDLCCGILALMKGKHIRSARYCCGMVLWHTQHGKCFETLDTSELQVIDEEPRGLNGFGYDPIVVPVNEAGQAESRTMAELSTHEKNRISHRGRAFQKVLNYLQNNNWI